MLFEEDVGRKAAYNISCSFDVRFGTASGDTT
jgi:hypothetical protein